MCIRDRFLNDKFGYEIKKKDSRIASTEKWEKMCIRERGWEPTTIEAIKAYRPSSNSLSSGQVLHCPYEPQKMCIRDRMSAA